MLVFTRKPGDRIRIGDDITVFIMDVKGRQVRIGIEAPAHVIVHRDEIYRRIQEENVRAAAVELESLNELSALLGTPDRRKP